MTTDWIGLFTVAFGVGIVVGLTGMGGGALMTPALIFLGVPPTTAVANDLVAAGLNKSVGAAVHWRHGSPNLKLVKWLVLGSVPFAFLGGRIVQTFGEGEDQQANLKLLLGGALLFTALTYAMRMYLELARGIEDDPDAPDPVVKPFATFLIGAVGGLIVGITSVGSGSLIMVTLLLLYPTLSAVKLVGTDLVQAVPLVISAAIGHVLVQGVDWSVLIPLILGGTPGTFLGARIARFVSPSIIRRGIVIVLTLTGLAMLKMPPVWVGISGAALVILGPLVWATLRVLHGVPAFDRVPIGRRSVQETDADVSERPTGSSLGSDEYQI